LFQGERGRGQPRLGSRACEPWQHRGDGRGKVKGQTIYVGHYNPAKPRSEAADRRVQDIGGNLKTFRAGQVHHMALEGSMLDHFTGGILNKYSEEDTDPIYWAVWTNLNGG
jgi:hypothetical protein